VRVNRDTLNSRLTEKRPGDTVEFTIFRFDELRTLNLKLGGRVDADYRVVPIENATDEQKKVYQSWLGASFPH
jgi:predicted metalloprotease with PDZ domain